MKAKTTSKLKVIAAGMLSIATMAVATTLPITSVAAKDGDGNASRYLENKESDYNDTDLMETLNVIVNVAIGMIGFIAVVVIILGGVSYATSAGDTAKVKKAKDTIMYGIIGLVVALLAYAIVKFVLSSVFTK